MNEGGPGDGEPAAEMTTLAWPLVAGIIGVLLVAVLGGSLLLSRAARPVLGVVPVQGAPITAPTAVTAGPAVTPAALDAPQAAAAGGATPRSAATANGATALAASANGETANGAIANGATTPAASAYRATATANGDTAPAPAATAIGASAPAASAPAANGAGANGAGANGTAADGAAADGAARSADAGLAASGMVSLGALGGATVVAFPTPLPTPTPRGWWDASSDVPEDVRTEIEQAYARFWQVRAQALLALDPGVLTEVMVGPELTGEEQAIHDLRANGRAQRVDVEHHERISWATSDAATVLDEYVSHTVQVDAETRQPVEDPPSASFRLAYLFRKVDGRWLAVDAVQVVYAQ